MAYETGTAANQTDLFDKLVAFVTTHPDLVADGQEWSKVWESGGAVKSGGRKDCVLMGPGLAGQQNIYIGLGVRADVVSDERWLELRGMSGLIGSAVELTGHVNVSPSLVRTYADGNPMTYWFVANGRRFAAIVKISTVFESLYAGLFLPYATPTRYPYPLLIGGTTDGPRPTAENDSWRVRNARHSAFPWSYVSDSTSVDTRSTGSMHLLSPANEWLRCGGGEDTSMENGWRDVDIHPTSYQRINYADDDYALNGNNNNRAGSFSFHSVILPNFDGSLTLTPITLCRRLPGPTIYGILDGCYQVPGVNNAAENVVEIEGVDYLVAQNTWRATFGNYMAMKLE